MSEWSSSRRLALVAALVVTALWSSSWVIIDIGLRHDHLPPVTFAGLRYGLAAVMLWIAVAIRDKTRHELTTVTAEQLKGLALLGVIFYAITQGAQYLAIDHQPVATTSLILTLTPMLVMVASGRLLGEGLGRSQQAAVLLPPFGTALYFAGALSATCVGLVAAVGCLAANAASSLLGRSVNRDFSISPLVITTIAMTIGTVVLLGVGVATEGVPRLSLEAVGLVAWLSLINTAVAFTLWNHSLQHLSAGESSVVNNAMLVQIALLGWVFLGQRPSATQWAGMIIVSTGVAVGSAAALRGAPTLSANPRLRRTPSRSASEMMSPQGDNNSSRA
jgi:drug/metabolite transporter (DMT)-like permease